VDERPEPDAVGSTLDSDHAYGLAELSDAVRYRDYLFELIEPHCGDSVLEVGAGMGDFADLFGAAKNVIASDSDPRCVAHLASKFRERSHVQVRTLDLTGDDVLAERVDTGVAINVFEHIEDDVHALRTLGKQVRPGGSIVILVPGYPALFGPFDQAVGHVRRYTPDSLARSVTEAGLTIEVLRPMNFIGGIAWWLAVKLGKRTRPNPRLIRLYDRVLVPIVRLLERQWTPPFGQSVFCVARTPREG
jgi:SAM-dependent methyltransferase